MPLPLLVLPALFLQPQASRRTLVFLGDSLTAGLGLPQEHAFPALIEAHIQTAGLNWKVVNAGVSGDTTTGVRARLDWILKQQPALIFLCIGSNDGLRGLPIREIERNLREILARCRRANIPVVLAGALLPDNYGPEYREAFRALFPRVAKAHRLQFLPFLLEGVAMNPDLNQADGIHPNARGSRIIAERVWSTLEKELRKPR